MNFLPWAQRIPASTGDTAKDLEALKVFLSDAFRGVVNTPGRFSTITTSWVRFPATQDASSNANTLDDYEEGTWTPTIAGSGTAGTQTYSANTGRYTKIGRLVMVEATIVMTAADVATAGNLEIRGFPFSEGGGAIGGMGIGYHSNFNLTAGYTQLGVFFNATGTAANILESGDNVAAQFLAAASLNNTSSVLFGGCYSV